MRETTATPNINNINNMKGKDAEQCDRKTVDILTFVIHKYGYLSCVGGEIRNHNFPTF